MLFFEFFYCSGVRIWVEVWRLLFDGFMKVYVYFLVFVVILFVVIFIFVGFGYYVFYWDYEVRGEFLVIDKLLEFFEILGYISL